MKKILVTLLLFVTTVNVFAQYDKKADELRAGLETKNKDLKEGWSRGGAINIGLNEGMLVNWAAGGEAYSMAVNGVFNAFATKVKGRTIWENTLDCYYGLNYVASNKFVPRKVDDRIDFSSRYLFTTKKYPKWYFGVLGRLQTQFSKGFNYSDATWYTMNKGKGLSNFLSPLYFTLAPGAEYRPNENFSVFVSPIATRMVFASKEHVQPVGDPSFSVSKDGKGRFGIDTGKTMNFEFGFYLTARYKTSLTKNIDYRTRLDLYSNYLHNPECVDIMWDNFFAIKINKYFGAGLGFTLLYDNDVPGQRTKDSNNDGVPDALGSLGWTQLKQMLNIGFNYKF